MKGLMGCEFPWGGAGRIGGGWAVAEETGKSLVP